MLHILLLILKVIGIILLAILSFILLIIGIVILTPIRYEALGKGKKELTSLKGKVTVTYLLKLVQVDVIFSEMILKWRVRIAWKKFMGGQNYSKEKKEEATKQEELADKMVIEEMKEEDLDALLDAELAKQKERAILEEASGESAENTVPSDDNRPPSSSDLHMERTDNGDTGQGDCADGANQPELEMQEEQSDSRTEETSETIEFKGSKKKEKEKTEKPGFEERIDKGIRKIKYTSKNIYDKIIKLQDEATDIFDLVKNQAHLKALLKVKKLVIKLLKKFIPKYIDGEGTIGFENPAVTGIVMAIYSYLYPFIDGKVDLSPDFERFIINGKLTIKGKFRLMSIVLFLLGIVVDINCWKTFFGVRRYMKNRNAEEVDETA